MTEDQAKVKADYLVRHYMNRTDLEDACRRRGIRIGKDKERMQNELIPRLTKEYMK